MINKKHAPRTFHYIILSIILISSIAVIFNFFSNINIKEEELEISLSPPGFPIPIDECIELFLDNHHFELSENLLSDGTCIRISGDNITLDGLGKKITGKGFGVGILLSGAKGTRVKNIVIENYAKGASLQFSNNNIFENVSVKNVLEEGFILYGDNFIGHSDYNIITNSEIDGANKGVWIGYGNVENLVEYSRFKNVRYKEQIELDKSFRNKIQHNTIFSDLGSVGIVSDGSFDYYGDNYLFNNTAIILS